MRQGTVALALLIGLGGLPLFAQQAPPAPDLAPPDQTDPVAGLWPQSGSGGTLGLAPPDQTDPVAGPAPACPNSTETAADGAAPIPWQTAWGLLGLRAMPTGLRVAPDGREYHPNFSLDLDLNGWVWRSRGIYLFFDTRLWGERSEYGVTNGQDSWYGTSKREIDLSGGAAWNYAGTWEARAFGYTNNNLNRGDNHVTPSGFTDGFGLENRYYLSPEYASLGQTGFDVTRADFLSVGYYPHRDMVGNDGQTFRPGLLLRAYLTCDLWDWPCYVYGDFQYIGDRHSFHPRLLLFDVGLAVRPFHAWRQWELRLGSENIADVQVRKDFSIGYVSLAYIF
jgi:hypothetical protein